MANKSRILKTVFTLKSGKSIVISMFEEQCFELYEQWVASKQRVLHECKDEYILKHEKRKNGTVYELMGIDVAELAAIQIVENNKYNS